MNTAHPINPLRRISFEGTIIAYFLLILLLIAGIIGIYKKINTESKEIRQWVVRSESILSIEEAVLSDLKDLTIETRGYLITRDEAFLSNVPSRVQSIRDSLSHLKRLTQSNVRQAKRQDGLHQVLEQYLAARQQSIDQLRNGAHPSTSLAPLLQASHKKFVELSALLQGIKKEEKQLLLQRREAYRASAQKASQAIRVLLLIFIASLLSAFVMVYLNVRKRNRAEAALRKNEGLIGSIIDHATVLVNVKDLKGRFLLVNRPFADALGAASEELIGKTHVGYVTEETARIIGRGDEEVMQTGQPCEMEVKLPGPDGEHTYITSKFPLYDEKGRLYAIGATSTDITPIKCAHEALARNYEQQQKELNGFGAVLSAASDVICIINKAGEFVRVSDTVRHLLGYTPKELMSKRFLDFVAAEDRYRTQRAAERVVAGQPVTDFTNHYRRKDGTEVPIIWSAKWLPEDELMYCIARNGTDQQQAARQLAQSRERLAYAQKIARLGNWDWDLEHHIWSCSDELYNLIGIRKEENPNVQQVILSAIYPGDTPRLLAAREAALTKETTVDMEHRLVRPDGLVRYMHTRGEVSLNAEGMPVWFSGTMQDITERKQTQLALEQLNRDLERRAEELKASNQELERFAYVASHDLQEPLRMVSSFLTLLQKKLAGQLDDTAKSYIHFAVDGAERMKGLIQDLLHYSRLGTEQEKFAPVHLDEVMDGVVQTFASALKENKAELKRCPLPVVQGHKTQLTQLFQNLVGNALKYRSEKDPQIEVGCRQEGEQWVFYVRDNGIGIDPRFFDKIFIIFQRLHGKSEYSGTGIGLAVCKKIVERHGGTIWVESTPGEGSTFYFTLKAKL